MTPPPGRYFTCCRRHPAKECRRDCLSRQDANNLYMWQLNASLGPDLQLRPHVLKDGQWSMLVPVSLRRTIPAADDFKTHHVEIETAGARSAPASTANWFDERSDATFASGMVGFLAAGDERFTVENVTVTDAQGNVALQADFRGHTAAFPNAQVENGRLVATDTTLLQGPRRPRTARAAAQDVCPEQARASRDGFGLRAGLL